MSNWSMAEPTTLDLFTDKYSYFHSYASLAICILGITGNIFIIVVLSRNSMRSSTNYILLSLAISDMLTMMTFIPYILKFYHMGMVDALSFEWAIFLVFHASFSVILHSISIYIGVLLAIFRYIYTCRNYIIKDFCRESQTKMYIIAIYLITPVLLLPSYMTYKTFPAQSKYLLVNSTRVLLSSECVTSGSLDEFVTDRGNSSIRLLTLNSQDVYCFTERSQAILRVNMYVQCILVKLLPCALMFAFTLRIISAIQSHARKKQLLHSRSVVRRLSTVQAAHARSSRMLVVVLILFLITEFPQAILLSVCLVYDDVKEAIERIYQPFGDVMDTLALLNNAINFTIYCTMSSQFRSTFAKIMCRYCQRTEIIEHSHDDEPPIGTASAIRQRAFHQRRRTPLLATYPYVNDPETAVQLKSNMNSPVLSPVMSTTRMVNCLREENCSDVIENNVGNICIANNSNRIGKGPPLSYEEATKNFPINQLHVQSNEIIVNFNAAKGNVLTNGKNYHKKHKGSVLRKEALI